VVAACCTVFETHFPNAFALLGPVPYFAWNAAAPRPRSALHDFAAETTAATVSCSSARAFEETHLPKAFRAFASPP
jgi:hypothetical protein